MIIFKANTYNSLKNKFVEALLLWNTNENRRKMPWKGVSDPYKIWLSEIILQQTRVEQGRKYYEKFINAFPTITHLANACEKDVFKFWEGLGYYNRCKNLLETARHLTNEQNGNFPGDYESIFKLKGIGSYTAAAISSFAYNLPHAVLDGNVYRVLSRIYNLQTPIDKTDGKIFFSRLASYHLPVNKSAEYNQAIMDFGAIICKPVPLCQLCFFNKFCKAFKQGQQLSLPVKSIKISIKERWFNYFILKYNNRFGIRQRRNNDIWQHLYEFPLIETIAKTGKKNILNKFNKELSIHHSNYSIVDSLPLIKQRLSHQLINFSFFIVECHEQLLVEDIMFVSKNRMMNYPFPQVLHQIIINKL